jgi:hypothetical protein
VIHQRTQTTLLGRRSLLLMLVLGLLLAMAAAGVARADTTLAPTPVPVDTSTSVPAAADTTGSQDPAATVPDQPVTGTDPATDPSVTPDPAPPVDPAPVPDPPAPVTGDPVGTTPDAGGGTTTPADPAPVVVDPAPVLPVVTTPPTSDLTDPSVPADNPPAGLDDSKPDSPPVTTALRPDRAPDTSPVTDSPDVPALAGPVGHLPGLPVLGRPDAYTVRAVGGPDVPSTAAAAAATAHAKRASAAAAERGGLALLGARAATLGSDPAGADARATRSADLSRTLSSTFATRGNSSTRITALGDAALLNVALPGGKGQSAGSRLLQFLAGYFVPPGGAPSSHLLVVVELALLGLLTAVVLPRSLLLRLTERAGAVHAGYRAVALRPG